jgi:uncharacterized protein (TIGR03437 family)
MRFNCCSITIASLAVLLGTGLPCSAKPFGTVVPIGGQASDIALDESRNVLYIANYTANRIDVMSTTDYSIRTSMNVAPQPGALALSPDSQFLLVAHYGNFAPPASTQNVVTLVNLASNTRQTFATGDAPLAVAFVRGVGANQNGQYQGLITTTTSLLMLDPMSGALKTVTTFANVATTLPSALNTFPSAVIGASMTTTPDGKYAFGIATGPSNSQAFFRFDTTTGQVTGLVITSSPTPLARLSASADGTWAMIGSYKWTLNLYGFDLNQFPNAIQSKNIGGTVVDSKNSLIYAQILTQPASTSGSPTPPPTGSASSATPPVLYVLDIDNLTVRDQIFLKENIIGRMVLSAASDMLYAVSDSGVTVFPIGKLQQYPRLTTSQSDVLALGSFCDQKVITQTLTITDPGGGNTDFAISAGASGVTVSPSSGLTPATVTISVNTSAFQSQNGTVTVPLTITSNSAVNVPPSIRLLVNNRNPDQRGFMVDIPGTLTDLVADPKRSRFYVLRQDLNQVLVFDSTTFKQIATLRTSTTPWQMAITWDQQYLVVGHDNSQLAFVYDLDTLQTQPPIHFPPGHYPRSLAASGQAMLAVVRNSSSGPAGLVDKINFQAQQADTLPSLGVFKNDVNPAASLAPAPNGGSILLAAPDGNVLVYDATADTFTASRQDFTTLQGAYAASSYNTYVVGNNVLNSSLVPMGTLETSSGSASGFAFVDQSGLRTTVAAASSPGVIQRVTPSVSLGTKPTRMAEAPLAPSIAQPFIRTVAPLSDRSAVITLTTSGVTVLPWNYDAAVAPPMINSVVNAADFTQPVAPGGLVTVFGSQLSPVNMASQEIPLPTALGESCMAINGVPAPLLFVSGSQINGQLPYTVTGNATLSLHTPGGVSDNYYLSITDAAPSIFRSGTAGPMTGLATVLRASNNQLVTPTNPIFPGDEITIYATGLGVTTPPVTAGLPAPSNPLALATSTPSVTLGGVNLTLHYAGLAPGEVGVYQINAAVPHGVPQGLDVPLVITQGGASTGLYVRVVN